MQLQGPEGGDLQWIIPEPSVSKALKGDSRPSVVVPEPSVSLPNEPTESSMTNRVCPSRGKRRMRCGIPQVNQTLSLITNNNVNDVQSEDHRVWLRPFLVQPTQQTQPLPVPLTSPQHQPQPPEMTAASISLRSFLESTTFGSRLAEGVMDRSTSTCIDDASTATTGASTTGVTAATLWSTVCEQRVNK